jgi:hypothetical protein
LASIGRSDLETVLTSGEIQLADWSEWFTGPARIALSFLRAAAIGNGIYGPRQEQTATFAMQMVLVAPAPSNQRFGRAGPSTYSEDLLPVPDQVILDFNRYLGPTEGIALQLLPAKILEPRCLAEAAPLNPDPASTILSIVILVFLGWAVFLLFRPTSATKDN